MSDTWDGDSFLAALEQAATTLRLHVDEVNRLNVFPVPDGDTGSNMLATLSAALAEARSGAAEGRRGAAEGRSGAAEGPSLAEIAGALSFGALMGARGNSGVILSQLLRGMSETLAPAQRIDGRLLADALEQGSKTAFASVARPVEGTLLSVACSAAEAAAEAAKRNGDLAGVLAAATEGARAAVERSPSQLATLRQAGVVDAGGRGLELILAGTLAYARGETTTTVEAADVARPPALAELGHQGYGYETIFIVTPQAGQPLDILGIRQRLEEMGDSVLVAGDERAVKVHIHNERPDEVIGYGLTLGRLTDIVVENLDRQADEVFHSRLAVDGGDGSPVAPREAEINPAGREPAADARAARAAVQPVSAAQLAVVAVAPGEGLARLFETLGARVVHAENGNPSAGELASAIDVSAAADVIVLPNNPNVRLAAEQAAALCADQRVRVVATRNAAEGVAALLAYDERQDIADNAALMARVAATTRTLQVTAAVRDTELGGQRVRRGEQIVLDADGELLAAGGDVRAAVVDALRALGDSFELLTVYRGEEVDAAQAETLADALRAEFAAEIELLDGGQRHYSLLIAAE